MKITKELLYDVYGIASILAVFVCSFVFVCSDAVRHYVGNGVTRTSKVLTYSLTYILTHSLTHLLTYLLIYSLTHSLISFSVIRAVYERAHFIRGETSALWRVCFNDTPKKLNKMK